MFCSIRYFVPRLWKYRKHAPTPRFRRAFGPPPSVPQSKLSRRHSSSNFDGTSSFPPQKQRLIISFAWWWDPKALLSLTSPTASSILPPNRYVIEEVRGQVGPLISYPNCLNVISAKTCLEAVKGNPDIGRHMTDRIPSVHVCICKPIKSPYS